MSDFPPPSTSAINTSKNKKKKNRKKNKKQENATPTPPIEGVSYADVAALPAEDEETVGSTNTTNLSAVDQHSATAQTDESLVPVETDVIPATGAPSFAQVAATPSSDQVLSEVVKDSIQSVIASRSIHNDKIVETIAKKVEAGEYNTKVPAVSHKVKSPASDKINSPPLSDAVKYGIQSVVGSQCIDLYGIVDTITKKVQAGEYTTPSSAKQVQTSKTPTFELTEAIQASFKSAVATPDIDLYGIVDKISKKVQSGGYKSFGLDYLNKSLPQVIAGSAIAAVTSAVTGTAALISEKLSSDPPLSENVEHCIQSAINARSIDVYGIIETSNNLKCPEPAVGKTMPSSAQKADIVPQEPKSKPPVSQKKSDLPRKENKHLDTQHKSANLQRKKKKDCIIL